ncbi:hypothetical protein BKA56DRAFT_620399 [Ilyonectria sp. MPI-CAGE-AT-0026]|nr:hypothetical protein BKA56DRAFT_620399 [Ilyonectria sp. MPI-CAGE-AT-0026]
MELSALFPLAAVIAIVYGVLHIAYGYIKVLYPRRRLPPGPFRFRCLAISSQSFLLGTGCNLRSGLIPTAFRSSPLGRVPQPGRFWPDRFLDNFDKPPYPNKRGHHTFGWGRRVCSGEPLVHQSMYIIAVRFLWAFNIRPGLDDKVSSPLPFRVRLEPRSEAIRDMLGEEAVAAASGLQAYDGEMHVKFESAQSVSFDMPVAQAET